MVVYVVVVVVVVVIRNIFLDPTFSLSSLEDRSDAALPREVHKVVCGRFAKEIPSNYVHYFVSRKTGESMLVNTAPYNTYVLTCIRRMYMYMYIHSY